MKTQSQLFKLMGIKSANYDGTPVAIQSINDNKISILSIDKNRSDTVQDMAIYYLIQEETLDNIADAIRNKLQNDELIYVSDFSEKIRSIPIVVEGDSVIEYMSAETVSF